MPSLLVFTVVAVAPMLAALRTRTAAPGFTVMVPAEVSCSLAGVVLPTRASSCPWSTMMLPA